MHPEVTDVLKQFNHIEDIKYTVEILSKGKQAILYSVRIYDKHCSHKKYTDLVVKLYNSSSSSIDVAEEERECLTIINRCLNGVVISGWEVHSPKVLFLCKCPLALVLTRVPGIQLEQYLVLSQAVTTECIESLAYVIVSALRMYWAAGARMYGDIGLENILCDLETQSISFLDPGKPNASFMCKNVPKNIHPASWDLACLLFQISVANIWLSIINNTAAKRCNRFIEKAIQIYIEEAQLAGHVDSLLSDIKVCTQVHIGKISTSWSPIGLWRMYKKYKLSTNVEAILSRLRTYFVKRSNGKWGIHMAFKQGKE